ncbi:MAG: family 78 glycoside hydrolase catalytic domain [Eubacteriales bacterium]|nr:family 78 glycoside hydrolase catalytic domain [Eubacteriales bacterium]
MLKIKNITVNYLKAPFGIQGEIQLGWAMESDRRNVTQRSYEIEISENRDFSKLVYESGVVSSAASAHVVVDIAWKDICKYYVRVRVSDGQEISDWKESYFITAYQKQESWHGTFISAETQEERNESGATLIRREFSVKKEVAAAYFVGTAHGLYRAYLNGAKIGEDEFRPGWTSYHKRLLYQIYDVSCRIRPGKNVVGVMLGAGWYKGEMGFEHDRNHYGTRTAFGGQIVLDYTDGTREVIASDTEWKGAKAPIVFSEIYDGEIYDAGLEQPGWKLADFDDSAWKKTEIVSRDLMTLYPQQGKGVQKITKLSPAAVFETPKGETVIDFGQNLTGWCAFTLENAVAGDVVELKCFEVLDAEGNVYTENLRKAKQTIRYICRGGGAAYHPHFTYQGFRYVQVVRFPEPVRADRFQAYAVHSYMEETGSFQCSNELLNRLQHNILWGMKGNFLDVPTDCPQRDERVGWTGDAQIFSSTATFLMNTYAFFDKWIQDVAADQREDGAVPHVVPDILTGKCENNWLCSQGCEGASAWADAAIIIPWNLYRAYGDRRILMQQYDSMKKWIEFMTDHSEEGCLFRYALQFGDWVALDAEEGSYFGATPTVLTSAAFYCEMTRIFSEIADILGRKSDHERYEALYEELKESFRKHFIHEDGTLTAQTQTAYIVALYFDLVPEKLRARAALELKKLLDKENGHLVTGFIGTPYFTHALSRNGYLREAYELLLKEDFPSWLYSVKMGATTIWEHWDGLKPDGSMWSADMNSFNHYAYGSVGDWMYRVIGGLEIDEKHPGYEHFYIQPQIGGGLTWAETVYESIHGTIRIRWEHKEDYVMLKVEIPVNTDADMILFGAGRMLEADGLEFTKTEHDLRARVGSGVWTVKYIA